MKLNYKRTILVGFAFFLICAFWQAYDATIPVILTNKYGMSQFWSGVIMALDNVLALFMLPLFGALSDKCKSKRGKRTPFIIFGTAVAAVALIALSVVDTIQLNKISDYTALDDVATLERIYDQQADTVLKTPGGREFQLSTEPGMTREKFSQIKVNEIDPVTGKEKVTAAYTNYVAPAREACVAEITNSNPGTLIVFVAFLLVILVAMSTFRSPAVALMPDVTVKPLRSKANAVINLMGTAGGIIVLVLGMVFATSAVKNSFMSYIAYYAVIAGLLHDIAYCEEMVTREDRMNHGRRSAAITRPFLEKLGLPADAVNEICYGIAIHVDDEADFEWERTLFCETVGDADNIDRFDAYRIYETLEYLKFSEMGLEDKCEKVAATIDKLNRFKEMKLGTATAKNLWLQRLDYYIGFYDKLKAQLDYSTEIL